MQIVQEELSAHQEGGDPLVGVVILNYNGLRDTVECLASLTKQSYRRHFIVVVDNGSSDGSVEKILKWGQDNCYHLHLIADASSIVEKGSHVLVNLDENLGFAKACNLGALVCCNLGAEYILLLNNDTVLDSNCIRTMVGFLEANKSCQIATPKIVFFDNPERVWNCGGEITWYGRRIYYTNPEKHQRKLDSRGYAYFEVGLVTGCALFVRKEMIKEGRFFTEKFFFGEEDFELSLRAKKMNIRMVCVLDAIIFHKVGGTINRNVTSLDEQLGRVYIFYLNRFVDFRHHYRYWWWLLWREAYLLYVVCWLLRVRYKVPLRRRILLAKKLRFYSSSLDGVTRDVFEKAMKGEWES